MSTRSVTLNAEIDVSQFIRDNNLSARSVEISSNSSGMPVVYFNSQQGTSQTLVDPADGGVVIAPRNDYADALAANQYTSVVSGLAGMDKVLIEINCGDVASQTINLVPRWSNNASPDVGTAADWSFETKGTDANPSVFQLMTYQVPSVQNGKVIVALSVLGAHLSLVYWSGGLTLGDTGTIAAAVI